MARVHPARFVSLCFVYLGVTYLAIFVPGSRLRLDLYSVSTVGVGLSMVLFGVLRLRSNEDSPTEYGPLTYFLAAVALGFTLLLLLRLTRLV